MGKSKEAIPGAQRDARRPTRAGDAENRRRTREGARGGRNDFAPSRVPARRHSREPQRARMGRQKTGRQAGASLTASRSRRRGGSQESLSEKGNNKQADHDDRRADAEDGCPLSQVIPISLVAATLGPTAGYNARRSTVPAVTTRVPAVHRTTPVVCFEPVQTACLARAPRLGVGLRLACSQHYEHEWGVSIAAPSTPNPSPKGDKLGHNQNIFRRPRHARRHAKSGNPDILHR